MLCRSFARHPSVAISAVKNSEHRNDAAARQALPIMQLTGDAVSELLARDETRVDGRDKVSGRTRYTADIKRPGMLWAAFTTSPYAHARIASIDTRPALEVDGVRACTTGRCSPSIAC